VINDPPHRQILRLLRIKIPYESAPPMRMVPAGSHKNSIGFRRWRPQNTRLLNGLSRAAGRTAAFGKAGGISPNALL
jgi:hypothetical protein